LALVATVAVGSNPTDAAIFVPELGQPQLIVANYSGNSLSVVPLGSDNLPGARRDLPLSGNPCRLAFGDLNGDKRDDLAVALFAENKVAVYAQASGSFAGDPEKLA